MYRLSSPAWMLMLLVAECSGWLILKDAAGISGHAICHAAGKPPHLTCVKCSAYFDRHEAQHSCCCQHAGVRPVCMFVAVQVV